MNSAKRTGFSRRRFLAATAAVAGTAIAPQVMGANGRRVVIVGGGFGGATCARYLKSLDASLDVLLIERSPVFVTCPFSNLVLAGLDDMASITHGYDGLRQAGVRVQHGIASDIDADRRRVHLAGGQHVTYDRLVLSPGIDLRFDAVPGYDRVAAEVLPHAWKAGKQTLLLRRQLEAMPDGGVVILAAPANPFRCPPGPYERASLIAHYLKQHKPKSKILLLDAKDKFSKQGLFQQGWKNLYGDMIEWVAGSEGGIVEQVRAHDRTLVTESGFTEHKGDVINFIPPQHAGVIARSNGLTDAQGWCPVDQGTFESSLVPGVHVIGDAAIAGKMPKSGFAANSQAKVCAAAIVNSLNGREALQPSYANTCYSLVGPEYGISVSAVYRAETGAILPVEGAGGVSPMAADAEFRGLEAGYARGWYKAITADIWG